VYNTEKSCGNKPYLALMQTSKSIQERLRMEIAKSGLSLTEYSVLEVLYQKGKQTIQQIGNSILISSGSMTYVIDKLEQKGQLKRNACPEDRRVIHVTLTNQGIDLMKNLIPKHQESVDYMFGDLHADDSQEIVRLLEKVNQRAKT
jgi:MarR family transcriptional regulator, 2-MHQ and catechol-resistance regulon repressor